MVDRIRGLKLDERLHVTILTGLEQIYVSGRFARAAEITGVDAVGVGALALATGPAYSVRLASDRLLIVGDNPLRLSSGWHDDGFAVSDMSAGLAVIDLTGEDADEIIRRATTLAITGESRSAAVTFAGISAILYRHELPGKIRLHVDAALCPYVIDWLTTARRLMAPGRNHERTA